MIYVNRLLIMSLLFISVSTKGQSKNIDTLINVGKYKLHFNVFKGKGVPILFESGAGNDGSVWNNLLKPLHDSIGAPLITYDREGFGKSELDTAGLNIINEIKGLEMALKKLGFTNKYFLVAHSLGGNYAMVFTSEIAEKSKEVSLLTS